MADAKRASFNLKEAVQNSVDSVKAQWQPCLAIQIAAVVLVIAYYQLPAFRQSFQTISEWKVAGGLWFAFIAGSIAGGIIPEVAKLVSFKLKKLDKKWMIDTAFNTFVYGIVGLQVYIFYHFQTIWFGDGNDFKTLALKTLIDMAFFSTIISIPTAVTLFELKRLKFNFKELGEELRGGYYLRKIVPALLPCWAFWTPILFCIYAFPTDLQYPISTLAEAAWSILFVFMATKHERTEPADMAN